MVTYKELFAFLMLIIAIIDLVFRIMKTQKK